MQSSISSFILISKLKNLAGEILLMKIKNVGFAIILSIATLTIANSSSAQITDPDVDQLLRDTDSLIDSMNKISENNRADALNWVQNASCSELEASYGTQMNNAEYWSNADTHGDSMASKLPSVYERSALETAELIASEHSRRC